MTTRETCAETLFWLVVFSVVATSSIQNEHHGRASSHFLSTCVFCYRIIYDVSMIQSNEFELFLFNTTNKFLAGTCFTGLFVRAPSYWLVRMSSFQYKSYWPYFDRTYLPVLTYLLTYWHTDIKNLHSLWPKGQWNLHSLWPKGQWNLHSLWPKGQWNFYSLAVKRSVKVTM